MKRRRALLLAVAYYLIRGPINFLVLTLVYYLNNSLDDRWVFLFFMPAIAVVLLIAFIWFAKPQNFQDRLFLAGYLILVSVVLDFFVSVINPWVCVGCFISWGTLITYLILIGVTLLIPLPHFKKPESKKSTTG